MFGLLVLGFVVEWMMDTARVWNTLLLADGWLRVCGVWVFVVGAY